jgi:hypothetical protein
MASLLKKQDRDGGRDRRWRANFKKLQRELTTLEEDEYQLDRVFPQVRSSAGGCAPAAPGAARRGRERPGLLLRLLLPAGVSAEGAAAAAVPGSCRAAARAHERAARCRRRRAPTATSSG